MKPITLLVVLFSASFLHGQIYFDGLLHETVGNIEYEIIGDSLFLTSMNIDEESGVDILLGETKGFGFTFALIDPILNPNGAYQEWRMIGTMDGNENQLLWKETHQVNNQNGLIRTEVIFDTSPIGAVENGINIIKNNVLVYEGVFDIGLIYTIEIDTSIVSIAAICEPKCCPAVWDGTCVFVDTARYQHAISLPDGAVIDTDTGDIVKIETYAINPANPPSSCSKIESRSYQLELSQFHSEGIVMFEERIPFYSLGDIIYETDSEFLKISEIDNSGKEGVRIPLDEASSFELNWLPISDYGNHYSIELSSKGLINQEFQTLGKVKHQIDSTSGQFFITADFSTFDTENKIVQVLENGNLVEEFVDFSSNEIAYLDGTPVSCGKLAQTAIDTPDVTICYFMEFEEKTIFDIQGVTFQGNEIRILSMTNLPIEHLSEFSLILSDIPELVIIEAKSITTEINEFEYKNDLFTIFPNPVRDKINIVFDYDTGNKYSYLIYNSTGRLVLEGKIIADNTINLNSLINGLYYLRIKDDSNSIFLPAISKIIKMN